VKEICTKLFPSVPKFDRGETANRALLDAAVRQCQREIRTDHYKPTDKDYRDRIVSWAVYQRRKNRSLEGTVDTVMNDNEPFIIIETDS
jgi:predicted Ser/Thr protein kinase